MIKAQVIADSKNPYGDRLTTMLVTFPRIILAEFNTHRMFSRNSASSRAIPFNKMVKSIEENPFIPIAWQKDHKGMQGTEYLDPDANYNPEGEGSSSIYGTWYGGAVLDAIRNAKELNKAGVTKQIVNRLLEPFMWHTVVVSATEWENFFALRCPRYVVHRDKNHEFFRSKKDLLKSLDAFPKVQEAVRDRTELDWLKDNQGQAEIHMMALAEAMWDAYNESTPKQLEVGDWHIPYEGKCYKLLGEPITHMLVDISTMMCARTSYTVVGDDGKEWDARKYFEKCKELKEANPFHASPFEHNAQVPTNQEYNESISMTNARYREDGSLISGTETGWFGNFKGFKQYRKMFKNENITV